MAEEFRVVDANNGFLAGDSCALNLALLKSDDDVVVELVVWDENGDFEFVVLLLDKNNLPLLLLPNVVFCIEFVSGLPDDLNRFNDEDCEL